jgi:hypothetical protein
MIAFQKKRPILLPIRIQTGRHAGVDPSISSTSKWSDIHGCRRLELSIATEILRSVVSFRKANVNLTNLSRRKAVNEKIAEGRNYGRIRAGEIHLVYWKTMPAVPFPLRSSCLPRSVSFDAPDRSKSASRLH